MDDLEKLYAEVIDSKDESFYLEIKKYIGFIISKRKFKKIIKKKSTNK